MKKIFYATGNSIPEKGFEHIDKSKREGCKFVSIDSLHSALYQGILRSLAEISKDQTSTDKILKRAQRYFAIIEETG